MNNELKELIDQVEQRIADTARAPVIDKLEKALEINREFVEVISKLKKHLGSDGNYSICRSDKEPMNIFEVIMIGNIFEELDELIKKAKGDSR